MQNCVVVAVVVVGHYSGLRRHVFLSVFVVMERHVKRGGAWEYKRVRGRRRGGGDKQCALIQRNVGCGEQDVSPFFVLRIHTQTNLRLSKTMFFFKGGRGIQTGNFA